MRISKQQAEEIRRITIQIFGVDARVYLFGSRLDDNGAGGDVDLFVNMPETVPSPANQAAQLAARVSRLFHGRKVDVVVGAPNLAEMPIHHIARATGVPL